MLAPISFTSVQTQGGGEITSLLGTKQTSPWWEKETIIADYFNNILGQKRTRNNSFSWDLLNLTCLINDVAECMDWPFAEQEVWQAIQQYHSEKVPGPDSFTGVFYRCCWSIIKGEVLNNSSCFHHLHTNALPQTN